MQLFFGKNRGKVINNKDPLALGRVLVEVPGVLGPGKTLWAMPSFPFAGKDVGFFAIPPIGTNIWVEFEQGNPDLPIWTGCFWERDQAPQIVARETPDKLIFLKTEGFMLKVDGTGSEKGMAGTDKGMSITVDAPLSSTALKLNMTTTGINLDCGGFGKIALKPDKTIEVSMSDATKAVFKPESVSIEAKGTKVEVNLTEIRLLANPAIATISKASGITLQHDPAIATIFTAGIELKAATPSLKINPATIDLSNAAASLKLSPITVDINNGALEVT